MVIYKYKMKTEVGESDEKKNTARPYQRKNCAHTFGVDKKSMQSVKLIVGFDD